MGHRLITALIFLNVMGFLACVALIAAAISKDDAVVLAQVTHAVFVSVSYVRYWGGRADCRVGNSSLGI